MSEPEEPTRRLFFALWPADALRDRIEHETRHATRHSGGRVIPARNLHITLAFLGSTPESRVADALLCQRETRVRPFELVLGELRWWERQELLCLEPSESADNGAAPLSELAGQLHKALRARGFTIEPRPFRAHMTLARDVRRAHEFKPVKQLRWLVDGVALVQSQTLAKGPEYSVVASVGVKKT